MIEATALLAWLNNAQRKWLHGSGRIVAAMP